MRLGLRLRSGLGFARVELLQSPRLELQRGDQLLGRRAHLVRVRTRARAGARAGARVRDRARAKARARAGARARVRGGSSHQVLLTTYC